MRVHSRLGPGLLESVYRECLFFQLVREGLVVEKEKAMPVVYEGMKIDHGFRIDLLVDQQVVVELKTVDDLRQIHYQQVLTYLRFGNFRTGLLINFNVTSLKNGLRRVSNSRLTQSIEQV